MNPLAHWIDWEKWNIQTLGHISSKKKREARTRKIQLPKKRNRFMAQKLLIKYNWYTVSDHLIWKTCTVVVSRNVSQNAQHVEWMWRMGYNIRRPRLVPFCQPRTRAYYQLLQRQQFHLFPVRVTGFVLNFVSFHSICARSLSSAWKKNQI